LVGPIIVGFITAEVCWYQGGRSEVYSAAWSPVFVVVLSRIPIPSSSFMISSSFPFS
jgi:hypothetical protein